MRRTTWLPRRRLLVSSLALILAAPCSVHATPASEEINQGVTTLPPPASQVLLIVDGAIEKKNRDGEAHLDLAMLRALPAHVLHTTTAVTDGVRRFDGFLLRDVLGLVGARGTHVEALALNNYRVDIPVADFHDYDVLLATHMDGERLLPSGKGPLWIVYPRDQWRQLQDIRYDYRWVWQLQRLTVK